MFQRSCAPMRSSTGYEYHSILYPQDTGGCERDANGRKAGKGALIQWEKSGTLGVSQDQTLFVWKETAQDPPTKEMDGR